jgi:non-specific serine/threonine protein kinase
MVTDRRLAFGELLRRHRVAAGLTQHELAERAGLSVRGISDLERGLRPGPHRDTVERLAQVLGLVPGQQAELLAERVPGVGAGASLPRADPNASGTRPLRRGWITRPLTSFIGRQEQIAELGELIETTRLVTLTGPGGIGKTRLAMQVAATVQEREVHDVTFVELSDLTEPPRVALAVALALGLPEPIGRSVEAALVERLQSADVILVLDNCEHLLAACASLANELLQRCYSLHILATSREPMAIWGEQIYRLSPLPDDEAVHLFEARARSVLPSFSTTDGNAASVVQLCRRLDGIPLTIELAAAWTHLLSVGEIADRLDSALGLLVVGNRVGPRRQQTLRATLDWSYGLLDIAEKRLFASMSVFAGGWTLEAAEGVFLTDPGQEGVLVVLARLVDKSLVTCERHEFGPVRYRLLETVRQFGAEQLTASADTSELRTRHMHWFVAMAERSATRLNTPQQGQYFEAIQQELANLRAAIDWAIECGDASAGLRLAVAMRQFWFHGHQTEGQAYLQTLLRLPPSPAHRGVRAAGLSWLATLTRERGDLVTARSLGEQAVCLAREVGDAGGLFHALTALGWTVAFQADWSSAEMLFQEARQVAETCTPWHSASAVAWLGHLRALQGDQQAARPLLEDAARRLREVGDREALARCLCVLADMELKHQRPAGASRQAREALEICQSLGHAWAWAARALDILVRVAYAQRQPERAITLAAAVSVIHPYLGSLLTRMARPDVVELARQELGTERAAALWAEGQAMTGDEAVALALTSPEMRDTAPDGARDRQNFGPLTRREGEVAQLVARGLTNRQIGDALVVTEGTAALHVKNALSKLGFRSRAELAAWVTRQTELSTR